MPYNFPLILRFANDNSLFCMHLEHIGPCTEKRYSGCLHDGGKMMVATARFVYPASVVVLTKTRIVIRINALISDRTNVQKYLSA